MFLKNFMEIFYKKKIFLKQFFKKYENMKIFV